MQSGSTLHLFDQFITNNYSSLYRDSKKLLWSNEYKDQVEDVLHSNILKVRDRIEKSGFTNNNLYGYLYTSLNNNLKKIKRDSKIVYSYDPSNNFDEDQYSMVNIEVEKYYQDQDHCSQTYLENLDILCRYSFKYVDIYYGQRNSTLWKTHILHKQTHKQIALQTGISSGRIKNILATIRTDLQLNIINYINYLTKENWKPVKHYEDLYQVSNKKRIKNRFNKIISPQYSIKNSPVYRLYKDGKFIDKSIEQIFQSCFNANQELKFERIICKRKKRQKNEQ